MVNHVEYDEAPNRPTQQRFLETEWNYVERADEEAEDGTKWGIEIEQNVRTPLQAPVHGDD